MSGEGPKTAEEVKEGILQIVRDWLEDPGNSMKISIECSPGMNGATGQPLRLYSVKGEATFHKAVIGMPKPLVEVPKGPVELPTAPGGTPR